MMNQKIEILKNSILDMDKRVASITVENMKLKNKLAAIYND